MAGARYEGEWKEGVEHGVGTLIEVDGSTFYGFWAEGKMHGEGVCPFTAPSICLSLQTINSKILM